MHNYKKLKVWQKTRVLVKDIYILSRKFPEEERFGLTSQIRRAVVSINLNISEGSGRTDKGFKNFLRNAHTSALEVENILILCSDLEMITEKEYNDFSARILEIQKMLFGLMDSLDG